MKTPMQVAELSNPQPGYYKRKLVRSGPWVPVQIVDMLGHLVAVVGLHPPSDDAQEQWLYCFGSPITQAEYDYLIARMQHARDHEPNSPLNVPSAPVDFARMGHNASGAIAKADMLLDEPALVLDTYEDAQASTLWIKRATATVKALKAEWAAEVEPLRAQVVAVSEPYKERIAKIEEQAEDEKGLLPAWRLRHDMRKVETEFGAKAYTRKTETLVIENAELIPVKYMTVDEAAVKAALKAGVKVPGARLDESPSTVVA